MTISNRPQQGAPLISEEEQARRKKAVDYARGSTRLEGHVMSDFAEDLNRRYIAGEITSEQLTEKMLARYKP